MITHLTLGKTEEDRSDIRFDEVITV